MPLFIEGEQQEKDFIKRWGLILKLRNILTSFDEFAGNEILSERDLSFYMFDMKHVIIAHLHDSLTTKTLVAISI